ncbi:B-cell receptor-associated protein 31-like, partial [Pyrgilauda ruficollis]|uniref:B-cell receptor-associated protein 31-like n=1 Tax=Pyrgilauda ruficollis TaxID=221976 RepID=UPI001B861E6C
RGCPWCVRVDSGWVRAHLGGFGGTLVILGCLWGGVPPLLTPPGPPDALRETRRYNVGDKEVLGTSPAALEHFHMKLFRAQRNLYLAGFALLLSFLLRRLVTLISAQAALGASSQAFRKQAEGASQAARQYLEDNDALRKVQ